MGSLTHNLGLQMRDRRRELGLTQAALASKLGYGPNTISNWELGKKDIGFTNLVDWANSLGLEVSLDREGHRARQPVWDQQSEITELQQGLVVVAQAVSELVLDSTKLATSQAVLQRRDTVLNELSRTISWLVLSLKAKA